MQKILSRFPLYDTTGLSKTVRKNLMLVLICILFGNVGFSVTGGTALTGYIKALGASDFAYSLLLGAPYVAKFMQLITSYVLEKTRKRRFLLIGFGLIARLMWIPVALVPYFIPANAGTLRIWAILVLVMLLSCLGAFNESAFNSLMADLVPVRICGRYFSARQRITMASGILSGFVMSWLLDVLTADGSLVGYTVVFVIAGIFGALDVVCYFWVDFPAMAEPEPTEKKDGMFTMMREVLSNKRYMKLIAILTLWTFSVQISGPFYNVHMLGPMQMSYTEVNVLSVIVSNVATLIFSGLWGGLMDRYGNKAVMRVFTVFTGALPLLWIFTGPRIIWMIPVIQFLSGMMWPGVDLSVQNMYLYQAPEKNRSMYFAIYFCITQMVGVALGYAAGGWLVDNVFVQLAEHWQLMLFGFEMNQYHWIFILSGLMRLSVSLLILRFLPESEKDVKPGRMLADIARHGLSGKRGLGA